tara:strand:+ start:6098 stop:6925 length:828 start_codon:yes stop_codon:yes gene_type:complete
MTNEFIFKQIKAKASFLCVGLDIDLEKIPSHLLQEKDPIFTFAKAIIDSTHEYAVAYKPNLAFFESYGIQGWHAFSKIINYLNNNHPNHFTIADAKRCDIGNTAGHYAKAFFETYGVDSVTISPYMGEDSVNPFLAYKDKRTIILALTSNESAADFQYSLDKDQFLFEKVLKISKGWKNAEQLMYVVGATKAEVLDSIRKLVPKSFLLVPGVGAQGGNLSEVAQNGMNDQCGLLVNSSRGIIYASRGVDFADAAAEEVKKLQKQMEKYLKLKGLI